MLTFDKANWYFAKPRDPTAPVYSTASGAMVPVTDATYVAWLASGGMPRRYMNDAMLWGSLIACGCGTGSLTMPQAIKDNAKASAIAALQTAMDAAAKQHGYDSINSACSYRDSPLFGAQATAFFAWRDAVWVYAIQKQATFDAGVLMTTEQLLAGLPALIVPALVGA